MVNYSPRCPVCDLPVPEQHGAGRPAVYCSRRCSSAAERDRLRRRLLLGTIVVTRAAAMTTEETG
jgi:predicted nucleic acid-binding Zn ribbon protein